MKTVASLPWPALLLPLLLLAAACGTREVGNPAPPHVETPAAFPERVTSLEAPVSASLADLQQILEQEIPRTLWTIDQQEKACVPAQRVTICPVPRRECRNGKCRMVGCKLGLFHTKVTPDVGCRLVGAVVRGPITLSGHGDRLLVSMPLSADVSAKDVGHVIAGVTATADARARAVVRLGIDRRWNPTAKVDLDYRWLTKPGIRILGRRITFANKADPRLRLLTSQLERDLPKQLAKVGLRRELEGLWRDAHTVEVLNRENPPAWLRITPRRLGLAGYRVEGDRLVLRVRAEALTETFVGPRPPVAPLTPLPPPARGIPTPRANIFVPVLADYAALKPILLSEVAKLRDRGIALPGLGPVDVRFDAVDVYGTSGGRLAVGVTLLASARDHRRLRARGTVWVTGLPVNESGTQRVRISGLEVAGRSDSAALDFLARVLLSPDVVGRIEAGLQEDFSRDYQRIIGAANRAVAAKRLGDFVLTLKLDDVTNGVLTATGQGLALPVEASGTGAVRYDPLPRSGGTKR